MTISVKTFKRLILLLLALLIAVPIYLAVHYGRKSAALERQLAGQPTGPAETGQVESSESPEPIYTEPVADPLEYQLLYPDLYGEKEIGQQRLRLANTVYLTFDTSLNTNTERILDILKEYDVKATFFVSGAGDETAVALMKRIVDEGHSIGLSSHSGSYQQIYQSVPAYLEDFQKIYDEVYTNTGVRTQIFRFPGGSVNAYNSGIYRELISEMLRRRFIFFDWNVSGEDTRLTAQSGEQIKQNVVDQVTGKDRGIVFLQDAVGKETVADALPGMIGELQERGYAFQPLTTAVLPVVFSYQSAP